MKNFFKDPRKRHGRFALALLIMALALAVLLISLADALEKKNAWRVDLSFNGVTTQSETTRQILQELDQPVYIYSLFKKGEEDQPLLELLDRYAARSEFLTWQPLDVTVNPGLIQKFQGDSDTALTTDSLVVYCPGTDRYRILNNFVSLGYDILAGGYTISGLTYEKAISEALVYVTRQKVPPVMFLTGHNEWAGSEIRFLEDYLSRNNYLVSSLDLSKNEPDPAGVVMILSPQVDLSQQDLDKLLAFTRQGGALFLTCDVTAPLEKMPNFAALMRSYGAVPREGLVVAGEGEPATFYEDVPIALIPHMQATPPTRNLIETRQDTLMLVLARAFEAPEITDNRLETQVLLYSGYQAYLHPLDTENYTYEQRPEDPLGPFPLALLSQRMTDAGEISRAVTVGNTTFMTDSTMYTGTDCGPFLLRILEYLLDQEAINLNIAAKTALRPGLGSGSLAAGTALTLAAPMTVLFVALWVLLRRRRL